MIELLDTDGENQAVRCFLGMYGQGGNVSIKLMKIHLEHSGFNDCWPEWVNQSDAGTSGHLTKGGAQDWLRYLFNLEPKSERIEALEKQNAELLAAVWAKQAAIDLLMLEYCPNEMSPEQIAEWAKHQRPSTQEVSE